MISASDIRAIIDQANKNGVRLTCESIARAIAHRTACSIGTADVQDKLDEMEAGGMIIKNGNGYAINPNSNL